MFLKMHIHLPMMWLWESKVSYDFDLFDAIFYRYKVAKRDNDSVYFEKVPNLSSLSAIQGNLIQKENF